MGDKIAIDYHHHPSLKECDYNSKNSKLSYVFFASGYLVDPNKKKHRAYTNKGKVLEIPVANELKSKLLQSRNKVNDIEQQFNMYASKWKEETSGHSILIHRINNPNYIHIIGLGKEVLPYILKDLEEDLDDWFAALYYIVKFNPVPKESMGKREKMRAAWLKWGRENQII